MAESEQYWVCTVHGVGSEHRTVCLENSHRLDLEAPALKKRPDPLQPQKVHTAVASDEEIAELRRRGFEVNPSRPHPSAAAADDALQKEWDAFEESWEFSSKVRAEEEKEARAEAEQRQRELKKEFDASRSVRAALGDPHALLSLAILDEYKGDLKRAAHRYREAADAGSAGAQFRLGLLYQDGKGVRRDITEAARWFRKAAEQRHGVARRHLGQLFVDGLVAAQDDIDAYRWLHVSLKGASPAWVALHDAVAARLTPAQREEAARRARNKKRWLAYLWGWPRALTQLPVKVLRLGFGWLRR